MSRIRVRAPESVKLDISAGDWLLVKKHLTAGERRRIFARQVKTLTHGQKITLDPAEVDRAEAAEYLLDWSLCGLDGTVIPIRGADPDAIISALDALEPETFIEVRDAISRHDTAMEKLRAAEKNDPDGAITSSAISPSVA